MLKINRKFLLDFLKTYFVDFLFVALIVGGSIYAWRGVLGQMIEGEGFYYFSPTLSFILPGGRMVNILTSFDNFPRLLYFGLEKTIGGNMDSYMWVLFITILLLNTAFYFFIKSVTKNRFIALLGTVLAGIDYSSNFQFYARGHFQWFAQRVPEFFPVLASFYFVTKFIDTKKFKDYFWALFLFVLAIFMSHYTTLLLPFFPGVFLATAIFNRRKKGDFSKYIFLSIPFILINYLIVSGSSLSLSTIKPNQTLLGSLFSSKDLIHQISFQLTAVTIPYAVFKSFIEGLGKNPQDVVNALIVPVYVFYAFSFWMLRRKKVKNFYFYIGLFLATLMNLFLNIYLNRVKVYNEVQQGRYYFIPSFFTAILLATFVYYYVEGLRFFRRKVILTVLFIFLAFYWVSLNSKLIHKQMKDSQYQYTGGRLLLAKLGEEKSKLPQGAYVMLPNPLMPLGEDFLKKFYSNGSTKFLFIDTKWKQRLPEDLDPSKLFVYDYSKQSLMVVDRSEEYRDQLSP